MQRRQRRKATEPMGDRNGGNAIDKADPCRDNGCISSSAVLFATMLSIPGWTRNRQAMQEFLLRRVRRAPLIKSLWEEYERMSAARDAAFAERDEAIAERAAALVDRDKALLDLQARERGSAASHTIHDFVLWAYRLLLGREPEQEPQP